MCELVVHLIACIAATELFYCIHTFYIDLLRQSAKLLRYARALWHSVLLLIGDLNVIILTA